MRQQGVTETSLCVLTAGTRCHWRVRVWDDKGTASDWSAPGWVETGLLSAGDWGNAEWVGKPTPSYEHWTDYTATTRFKLNSTAFGMFLRAQSLSNTYMSQVNVSTGVPMMRPHLRVNSGFNLLGEIDLRPFGFTLLGEVEQVENMTDRRAPSVRRGGSLFRLRRGASRLRSRRAESASRSAS